MIEYNDGTFGEIKPNKELLKELFEKEDELNKIKTVHFGTEKELTEYKEIVEIIKEYGETLLDVNNKLDKIIKHLKIVEIIGE